jgi:uncharacterized protein
MKFLLDVNALVALGFLQHEFHARTAGWVRKVAAKASGELATCSITELGFVRVLLQTAPYQHSVLQAKTLLLRMKRSNGVRFYFLSDDQDISGLPGWVATPKQVTDGHLQALAKNKGCQLATLDKRIPGAFVIPG